MLQHLWNASIGAIGGADGPTAVFVTGLNMDNVNQALNIMGKGMLGIFVVIGLIAIIVTVLSRLGNNR